MSGILCAAAAGAAGASAGLTLIDVQIVSNTANATTVVVNKPVGTASGDLLVAVMISSSGAVAWTQAAGFTEVLDVALSPFGGVSWRAADGTEGAAFTFTASLSRLLVAAVLCFRHAAFDSAGTVGSGSNAPTAPSITMSGDGLTLAVFASNTGGGSFTTPTGCAPVASDSDSSAPSMALFRKAVAGGATAVISSVLSGGASARGLQIGVKRV